MFCPEEGPVFLFHNVNMLHFCQTPFLRGADNSLTSLFICGSREACAHQASSVFGDWMLTSLCFPRAKDAAFRHSCRITAASGSPEVWETSTLMALGHTAAAQSHLSPGLWAPSVVLPLLEKAGPTESACDSIRGRSSSANDSRRYCFSFAPRAGSRCPASTLCLPRRAMGKQARADCWQ